MIKLREAWQFDTTRSETLYVDETEIETIGHAVVGERSNGSMLTMKSGEKHRVWESADTVIRLVAAQQSNKAEGFNELLCED